MAHEVPILTALRCATAPFEKKSVTEEEISALANHTISIQTTPLGPAVKCRVPSVECRIKGCRYFLSIRGIGGIFRLVAFLVIDRPGGKGIVELMMEVTGTVNSILSRKGSDVWSIPPDATVFEAIQLMAEKNVGALPVVQNGQLVGIISERDYTRKVILQGKSSKETPVRDIMTQRLVTADPDDRVSECMRRMTENRVRHLPVLEGNKIVGSLSIGDLLAWLIAAQRNAIDNLERYVTGDFPSGY